MKYALLAAVVSGLLLLITLLISLRPGNNSENPDVTPTPDAASYPTTIPLDPQATPAAGKAKVTGQLCPVSQNQPTVPALQIVAEHIPSRIQEIQYYPGSDRAQTTTYSMELEPGIYEFYTQDFSGNKLTLYSQYVTCGSLVTCINHQSIQLQINQGQIEYGVDLCDNVWRNPF